MSSACSRNRAPEWRSSASRASAHARPTFTTTPSGVSHQTTYVIADDRKRRLDGYGRGRGERGRRVRAGRSIGRRKL